MADGKHKNGVAITVIYQAVNEATGKTIKMDVYDEAHAEDVGKAVAAMTEFAATGRYYGVFTPDAEGDWTVVMKNTTDGNGAIVKFYPVGGHNIDSIGDDIASLNDVAVGDLNNVSTSDLDTALATYDAALGSEVAAVDTKVDTVDGKIVTVDGKVDTVDAKVVTVTSKVDAVDALVANLDADVVAVKSDTVAIASSVSTVDGKVVNLDADVVAVKTDTATIITDVAAVDALIDGVVTDVAALNDISAANVATELETYDAVKKSELDAVQGGSETLESIKTAVDAFGSPAMAG